MAWWFGNLRDTHNYSCHRLIPYEQSPVSASPDKTTQGPPCTFTPAQTSRSLAFYAALNPSMLKIQADRALLSLAASLITVRTPNSARLFPALVVTTKGKRRKKKKKEEEKKETP